MDADASSSLSPYALLLHALSLVPLSHYLFLSLLLLLVLFYNLLEIHFLHDLFTAFRGDPVNLIFHSSSPLCQSLAATCHVLRGRYLSTPWLSGPHLQTAFLTFFGRAPNVTYKRQLFRTVDGGTIALDWLYSDVLEDSAHVNDTSLKGCKTPIVIVIPGLTSDSTADYIKHFAFKMARQGRNVVVSNHRGLAGVSLTSDCFYNAGWTEDIRKIVEHIHSQYPEAPLYVVGTSIGANILVKYLGEDGVNTPIVGAAAICSPWDLLICDRFINRKFVQKFYNRVLAVGLQGYAQLHQSILTRLANWNNIKKSHSVRDFDDHATRVLGKFETVDSYYRHSSSTSYVRNVSVPLLCISALDDPVCTREAIPLDECRANENVMLATTQHGGHLAFYEGINASSLWWVRAVDEFLGVLHSSPFVNRVKKVQESTVPAPSESLIDQGPYVNVVGDGMVAAAGTVAMNNVAEEAPNEPLAQLNEHDQDVSLETEKDDRVVGEILNENNLIPPSQQPVSVDEKIVPMRRQIDQLSRYTRISIWLLAWIAFSTTWPWLGFALTLFLKRRFKRFMPTMLLKR
ncbi:phospholipase ABHD3 isoform X1 [Mangifera indica]|uniref:phospholipase ABHD3 isoform X1 n=1 Tax=Mangifera indica TaxID=29780 RepID=UPI001CFBEC31|nr:phospholipase ABHD3 isoform X1 [Mangifera indica]